MNPTDNAVVTKEGHVCDQCGARPSALSTEQSLYAIGQLDVRFPTIGVEREFQQRERALASDDGVSEDNHGARIAHVLRLNPHLWSRVCFIFSVGNTPAYIVSPSSQHTLQALLDAASAKSEPEAFAVLIGRHAGTSAPGQCGGLMAPLAICDQLYASTVPTWVSALEARVKGVLESDANAAKRFGTVARELFLRVVQSTENIGALDSHRALNYVLVQHPGFALGLVQRPQCILDRIETRAVQGTDLRRVVAVILTLVDRTTGVAERLFCRVDVTEQWPFVVEDLGSGIAPLAFAPYVENALLGAGY